MNTTYLLTMATLATVNLAGYILILNYGRDVIRLYRSYKDTVSKLSDLTMTVLENNTKALVSADKDLTVLKNEIAVMRKKVDALAGKIDSQQAAEVINAYNLSETIVNCSNRLKEVKEIMEQSNRHHSVLRNLLTIGKGKKR